MSTAFQTQTFHPTFNTPIPTAPAIPSGTFAPGTKVQVGGHRVVIEKYLSEGGFAHVYLVRLPKATDGDNGAVLKRVAVPDKESLASMRTEVETMKKLKGRPKIVTYIDSHASQLKGGGYEVFLLMEYCNGGGLIDFMNTRLQNRLTEPEILKIFSDVAQGVACMHYLKPPLLHRDLKVENVLITKSGSMRQYKLCDFGSTAPPRPAATNAVEGRLIEDDVQKHTTLQYRSPEMIDVYRKQPIDEKSDIWALGVLLYKLCYYKTPFEEQGQMAILNASFKFPSYPSFSDKLKKLIASMLRETPQQRPNIYQVVREVCLMRGTDTPIKDIYVGRTSSEARQSQRLPPSAPDVASPPIVAGAFKAPPSVEKQSIPDITPMRRGRPTKAEGDAKTPKPDPSPLRGATGDPFTALDSSSNPTPGATSFEDASARFPALDDFSILNDSGGKFAFTSKPEAAQRDSKDIGQRVVNALADEAFVPRRPEHKPSIAQAEASAQGPAMMPKTKAAASTISASFPTQRPSSLQAVTQRPTMVSTGTMTSPEHIPPEPQKPSASGRPIFRFPPSPSASRSTSRPRTSDAVEGAATMTPNDIPVPTRPNFLSHRSRSQTQIAADTTPKPSRTSLEAGHRSSLLGGLDSSMHRSKSANSRSRPTSSQEQSKPNLLRRLSREKSRSNEPEVEALTTAQTSPYDGSEEAIKIDSNVDYLKAMEEEESSKRSSKRLSGGSKHGKRASMPSVSLPSVSLSGTKSMLAGRFGEAFRKFETSTGPERRDSSRSPSRGPNNLTPIAGSEATDDRSDDGNSLEESEEAPPEVRRELERRRLSQEERRVAEGAASYRQRLAEGDGRHGNRPRPNNKAASIQSKVKSLLDESGRASPSPTKNLEGYGRFTERPASPGRQAQSTTSNLAIRSGSRQMPTQPLPNNVVPQLSTNPRSSLDVRNATTQKGSSASLPTAVSIPRHSGPASDRPFQRPSGPPRPQPKPQALRTGDGPSQATPKASSSASRMPTTLNQQPTSLMQPNQRSVDGAPDDDWETNFSKRYPDLSGLKMVETEIPDEDSGTISRRASRPPNEMRIKDV